MRRRSITGPVLLLLVGVLFLWHNLHPESAMFDLLALYWPFLLITWGALRLIEVLLWHSQGQRTGLAWYEIVVIVMICIAGTGVWEARSHGVRITMSGIDIWGPQYDYPISAQAPAQGVKRIVIESGRGDIRISGADAAQVLVSGQKTVRSYDEGEADRANSQTPVEITPEGDALLIRSNAGRVSGRLRVSDDLDVIVPASATIEVRGGTGDIEIAGVQGDVEVRADEGDVNLSRIGGNARLSLARSGSVRAAGVKGDIALEGRGSDIDFSDIEGQVVISGAFQGDVAFRNLAKPLQFDGARDTELRVAAAPGTIAMDLGDFSATDIVGPVKFVTRSRDVSISRFTGPLEVDTDRGDVELLPGSTPLSAITAHSGMGDIDLGLPADASFRLEATAEMGDAVNDFGSAITAQRDGRKATLRGASGQGPSIRLTVDRGSILVRKQGALPPAPPRPPEPSLPPTPPQPPRPKGTQL